MKSGFLVGVRRKGRLETLARDFYLKVDPLQPLRRFGAAERDADPVGRLHPRRSVAAVPSWKFVPGRRTDSEAGRAASAVSAVTEARPPGGATAPSGGCSGKNTAHVPVAVSGSRQSVWSLANSLAHRLPFRPAGAVAGRRFFRLVALRSLGLLVQALGEVRRPDHAAHGSGDPGRLIGVVAPRRQPVPTGRLERVIDVIDQ